VLVTSAYGVIWLRLEFQSSWCDSDRFAYSSWLAGVDGVYWIDAVKNESHKTANVVSGWNPPTERLWHLSSGLRRQPKSWRQASCKTPKTPVGMT